MHDVKCLVYPDAAGRSFEQAGTGSRPQAAAAALVGALIAVLVQSSFVAAFGVNLPYWDEWANAKLLALDRVGALTWHDLVVQHNEHRVVLGRLLWIGLFRLLGDWSPVAEMLLSALLAGGIAASWCYTLARLGVAPWVGWASSLLLVSPAQWENILSGFQIPFYTLGLSSVLGICAISLGRGVSWPLLFGAALAASAAMLSLASGLVVWPVLGACLALKAVVAEPTPRFGLRDRGLWPKAGVFALVAAAHIVSYVRGLDFTHARLYRPSGVTQASHWVTVAAGYPFVRNLDEVPEWVVAAVLLQWTPIALAVGLHARDRDEGRNRDKLVLVAGLVLLVLTNALVIAGGRAVIPAVASRYGAIFMWISVLGLLGLAELLRHTARRPGTWRGWAVAGLCVVLGGFLVWHGEAYRVGIAKMQETRAQREQSQASVVTYLGDRSPVRRLPDPIPFPSREYLQALLDDPARRAVLPSALRAVAERAGARALNTR